MMTKDIRKLLIVALGGLMLAACQTQSNVTASPTFTPAPTATERITATATETSQPTITSTSTPIQPTPTSTPIPLPDQAITMDNIDQVVQIARWGKGAATAVDYSRDGKYLAVASKIGVYLYDAETYDLARSFEDFPRGVEDISFSPDSNALAVVADAHVDFISIPDGKSIDTLAEPASKVSFSPDGKLLAVANNEGVYPDRTTIVKVFNFDGWELVYSFEKSERVLDLEFSPDGKHLGLATTEGVIIWNLDDQTEFFNNEGELTRSYNASTRDPLSFSPDGLHFAVIVLPDIYVYTIGNEASPTILALESYPEQRYIVYSPDGGLLAAISFGTVSLWDADRGTLMDTFNLGDGVFTDFAWSRDGAFLAAASNDEYVPSQQSATVWNMAYGRVKKNLEGHSSGVDSLFWIPDGKSITFSNYGMSGLARVLRVIDGSISQQFSSDRWTEPMTQLAYSPLGGVRYASMQEFLYFGALHDESGNSQGTLAYSPFPVAFSADGRYFASIDWGDVSMQDMFAGIFRRVLVWEMDTTEVVQSFQLEIDQAVRYYSEFMFSASGKSLYVKEVDRILHLDMENGAIEEFLDYGGQFSFSPDEKSFISISPDKRIINHAGTDIQILADAENLCKWCMPAWAPDGGLIAVPMSTGEIIILDAGNGNILKTLQGHTTEVTVLAFSPDGTMLASGSLDGTVRLWGVP